MVPRIAIRIPLKQVKSEVIAERRVRRLPKSPQHFVPKGHDLISCLLPPDKPRAAHEASIQFNRSTAQNLE
ncbi:hypothetical protein SISSUDRAFT_199996 [Sistotremastrum suecicum HHB10207 ss-3]|uniref:Uncharacterized protein n=1 Tax=Sistotremastrum suecicum HHB10207 ss-3 TaxID=1314776 RepID=A0A166A980_9AGAM|nr:hypothetical protein SISSUDRAFT_199996 [Sistotremastrum suecicum HHB10207 ss-3]